MQDVGDHCSAEARALLGFRHAGEPDEAVWEEGDRRGRTGRRAQIEPESVVPLRSCDPTMSSAWRGSRCWHLRTRAPPDRSAATAACRYSSTAAAAATKQSPQSQDRTATTVSTARQDKRLIAAPRFRVASSIRRANRPPIGGNPVRRRPPGVYGPASSSPRGSCEGLVSGRRIAWALVGRLGRGLSTHDFLRSRYIATLRDRLLAPGWRRRLPAD